MKFLITCAGTAGHINPALAIAGKLKELMPDSEFLFVGSGREMENRLIPMEGYEIVNIKSSGFQRKISAENIVRNVKAAANIVIGSAQAKKLIREFKPDAAIGTGGYVCYPVLSAAAKMGIPTAIHEQNAYPGVTNKALAEKVDAVMLTAEEAANHMKFKNEPVVTGLPIRGELLEADPTLSRQELGFDNRPIILCMGGSLGAREINKAIVDVIASDMYERKYNFIVSTGQNGVWVPEKLADMGVDLSKADNVQIRPYIDDMARCLSACDLVICRAGASSLSEFQALGKASILIPSPNVTENHQYHNAMALVNNNAAVIIEEKDLDGKKLGEEMDRLLSDKAVLKEIGDFFKPIRAEYLKSGQLNPTVLATDTKALKQIYHSITNTQKRIFFG